MGAIMSRRTAGGRRHRPRDTDYTPRIFHMIADDRCINYDDGCVRPTRQPQLCSICGRPPRSRVCNNRCRHVFCFFCIEEYLEYESHPKGIWSTRTVPLVRCPDAACEQPIQAVRHCIIV